MRKINLLTDHYIMPPSVFKREYIDKIQLIDPSEFASWPSVEERFSPGEPIQWIEPDINIAQSALDEMLSKPICCYRWPEVSNGKDSETAIH